MNGIKRKPFIPTLCLHHLLRGPSVPLRSTITSLLQQMLIFSEEDPLRREWLCTPVFWPGEVHGLYSPWGRKESDLTGQLSHYCGTFSSVHLIYFYTLSQQSFIISFDIIEQALVPLWEHSSCPWSFSSISKLQKELFSGCTPVHMHTGMYAHTLLEI